MTIGLHSIYYDVVKKYNKKPRISGLFYLLNITSVLYLNYPWILDKLPRPKAVVCPRYAW